MLHVEDIRARTLCTLSQTLVVYQPKYLNKLRVFSTVVQDDDDIAKLLWVAARDRDGYYISVVLT